MKYLPLFLLLISSVAHSECNRPTIVAVVDSGLNLKDDRFARYLCKGKSKDFTDEGIEDIVGHGTHVSGLITQGMPRGFCIMVVKYYSAYASGIVNLKREVEAIKWAAKQGADIVNISGGGPQFQEDEYIAIKANPQMTFVVAAGNDNNNIDYPFNEYYPASYKLKNVIAVGARKESFTSFFSTLETSSTEKTKSSNFGKTVKAWELGENVRSTIPCKEHICYGYMTGTSQATAIHTRKMVKQILKSCDR